MFRLFREPRNVSWRKHNFAMPVDEAWVDKGGVVLAEFVVAGRYQVDALAFVSCMSSEVLDVGGNW